MTRRKTLQKERLYEYLIGYWESTTRMPTYAEMKAQTGVGTSALRRALAELAEDGLIEVTPRISRGIRILRFPESVPPIQL